LQKSEGKYGGCQHWFITQLQLSTFAYRLSPFEFLLAPGSLLITQAAKVILCISPAAGSATFGYIYLATHERPHEEANTAYFNNASHEVSVIPYPNFEAFMVNNHLSNRDIVFFTDLPCHIIPAGICILQANRHNDTPNLNWMPPPPDSLSFISLRTTSS
jgi:hypothetical protein